MLEKFDANLVIVEIQFGIIKLGFDEVIVSYGQHEKVKLTKFKGE